MTLFHTPFAFSPVSPYLRTATEIALETGKILLRCHNDLDQIKVQSKGLNDPVSNIDLACERQIVERLQYAYPEHAIMAEEGAVPVATPAAEADSTANAPSRHSKGTQYSKHAETKKPASDMCWIIDPIDGTTNFIRGLAHCAISIALMHQQDIILGVVYDPFKDELFCAEKGEGATLNRRRIRVRQQKDLAGSVLATGLPYRPEQDAETALSTVSAFIKAGANIRRMGAASLDLCYVACGRFDGFWEADLQSWDIAAGICIVEESGGLCCDLDQYGTSALHTGNILASTPSLHKKMWSTIQKSKASSKASNT